MASIIKDKARVFNANQFLNLFSSGSVASWSTGTIYTTNEVIINSGNEYVSTTSGTSGGTPPTHVSGVLSDGGVLWQYVKPAVVTNFYNNNLFISIGQIDVWGDPDTPPQAMNYISEDYDDLINSVFMKKTNSASASLGIKRNAWDTSGSTVYDSYRTDVELDTITYYVTNSSNNIYICIDNNGGIPSTAKPDNINTTIDSFKTGDGYTWKFVGNISDTNFMTTDYFPVSKLLADNGSAQWDLQQNASSNSISFIGVDDAGATFPTAVPTVSITGDAVAVATLVGDVLTEITITDSGTGYTEAPYVAIIPHATDLASHQPTMTVVATAGVIDSITIVNGGQYDPALTVTASVTVTTAGINAILTPVFTDNVLTSITVTNGGSDYVTGDIVELDDTVNNEAHDVIITASVITGQGLGANVLEDCNAKYVIINENMVADESGYLPEDISFRQILLVVDPLNNDGETASASRYIGPAHVDYATTPNNEKVMLGTGSQLYTDNIDAISRSVNQQESIKIILKF